MNTIKTESSHSNERNIGLSVAIWVCAFLMLVSACQPLGPAQAYPAPEQEKTATSTVTPTMTIKPPRPAVPDFQPGGKIVTPTVWPTPTAVPDSWKTFNLSEADIQFRYPEDWVTKNPYRYSGQDGFFEVSLHTYANTVFGNLRTMCTLEANLHKADLYGEAPTVIEWRGWDQGSQDIFASGCGVIPSNDAPRGGEAVLFARFNTQPKTDQILVLRADPAHFYAFLDTLHMDGYVTPTPQHQNYTSPLCVLTGMERVPVVTQAAGLTITEYPIVDAACHPYVHLDSFQPLVPWQAQRPDAKWYKWTDLHRAGESRQIQVGTDTIRWQDNDTHTFHVGAPTQYDILRNEEVVMTISIPLYTPGGGPVRDLWTWEGHWVLEVETMVIMDGVIQNQSLGYEEMFNWHLVDGRPFYFYRQQDSFGMVYDGQTLPLRYDQIIHGFLCCDPARYSIMTAPIGARFYAQRDGVWWFVEVQANE